MNCDTCIHSPTPENIGENCGVSLFKYYPEILERIMDEWITGNP